MVFQNVVVSCLEDPDCQHAAHNVAIKNNVGSTAFEYDCVTPFPDIPVLLITEPFEETEEKWLSLLENSRWLEYVRYDQGAVAQ